MRKCRRGSQNTTNYHCIQEKERKHRDSPIAREFNMLPRFIRTIEAEKVTKERKTSGAKKDKSGAEKVLEDELKASQDRSLVVLDCIAVQ